MALFVPCGQENNGGFCVTYGKPKPKAAVSSESNDETWLCSCGQENSGGFCVACGKPKPKAAVSSESNDEKWLCSCGQENVGGFCVACGKPKPKENSTPKQNPLPKQSPPLQQSPPPKQSTPPQQNIESNFATPKSSNKNIIIGAMVGVLLLAGGGFFAWQNSQNDEPVNDEFVLKNESAAAPENTTVVATYYVVNCDKSVTLRKNPSTAAVELAQVPLGQAVGFIEESGDSFCKVNHAGKVGYILSQYLSAEKPAPVTNTPAKNNQPANNSALSLGGVSLGDSVEKMHSVLGHEDRINKSQYEYKDIVVTVKNGAVTGLVSYSKAVQTEKGIREGGNLQQIISAYGRRCAVQNFDGSTLYEFPYDTPQGSLAVMRFAIKNGVVDYISLRLVSDAKEKSDLLALIKII